MADFKAVILDLDGVIYVGQSIIPGARKAVLALRKAGIKIGFLTNNSGATGKQILGKLKKLGVEAQFNELLSSAQAAASVIQAERLDQGRGVVVFGTDSLREELTQAGLKVVTTSNAGCILVGHDPAFNDKKLAAAIEWMKRPVPAIACNRDMTYPIEGGVLKPGCGAIVEAIESGSKREFDRTIGKPEPYMLETIASRLSVSLADCILVGDSLDSDIAMAKRAGVRSIWICPGSATPDLKTFVEHCSLLT